MSVMHFITGKGGTGKSTCAAALAQSLSRKEEGPVLLLEVQGSGRAFDILGTPINSFQNKSLYHQKDIWGARIFPRETFKQYFSLLLAIGNQESSFASATSVIREKIVDMVFENKVISAFIDTCPGLEPAVLLGKLHWEATQGSTPETKIKWAHVVVDAPATGHGLMLFKSAFALTEVFSSGIISKQAGEIRSFVTSPAQTKIYITSTVEELPLMESLELIKNFRELNIEPYSIIFNRCKNFEARSTGNPFTDSAWKREYDFEIESAQEQKLLIQDFQKELQTPIKQLQVPEFSMLSPSEDIQKISSLVGTLI